MQTDAGRVGEHVKDVALGPAATARGAERPVLVPVALPAGLDLEVVVGHVLLYPVAAVPVVRQNVVRAAGKRFGIASRVVLNQGSVGGLRNQTEPRCHGRYQARIVAPTLHPGITQEVAPNESQRDPNATTSEALIYEGLFVAPWLPS